MAKKSKTHTTAQERRRLRRELPPIDLNQRYPIQPDALAYADCAKKSFYAEIKARGIVLLKAGRRSFISGADLARLAQPAP